MHNILFIKISNKLNIHFLIGMESNQSNTDQTQNQNYPEYREVITFIIILNKLPHYRGTIEAEASTEVVEATTTDTSLIEISHTITTRNMRKAPTRDIKNTRSTLRKITTLGM
jgi:hypothetical protein